MKKIISIVWILVALLTTGAAFGQECMTYQEFEKNGRTMASLDSIYSSAIHPDSLPGPFNHRQSEVSDSWTTLLIEVATFLSGHGYVWGRETWCHVRIYFAANGTIDY